MNFVEELKWRGMIQDMMPGTEELLNKEMTTAYVGIDPTSDSLHIGHLVSVMMLKHFQRFGHRPLVLVGGATGMIGDPSGKSLERNLLDIETLCKNQESLKKQLSRFLDFDSNIPNKAEMVNNYDWMSQYSFLDFIRLIGKHITVNYMMAKDSVKKRINGDSKDGMSFTEFSYQLVQGTDFLTLYREKGCKLQMGGSDQWGNIITGTELIRRAEGGEAFALTCPLIKKADGTKFGKTESGNVWLDREKTSPYKFYQFWINVSDEDAEKYIKIFTILDKEEISTLTEEHKAEPHIRKLQRKLAEEVTIMIHGKTALEEAIKASDVLFKGGKEDFANLSEKTFVEIFDSVPAFELSKSELQKGIGIIDLLSEKTNILPSKGESRKILIAGGINLNKQKASLEQKITYSDLIHNNYIIIQKGKKNYNIIKFI